MTKRRTEPENFRFLEEYDPRLERLGRQAESYVHTDPDSCLFKLRLMVETMAKRLVEMERPDLVSRDLGTMLQALERSNLMTRRQADALHAVRRDGNAAVHGQPTSPPTAMRRLSTMHWLAACYARLIRRGAKVKTREFVPPAPPRSADERVQAALADAERLEDEIEERRRRTREALMLYGYDDDVDADAARLRGELEALDRIAAEAGEPLVDVDSVMLIMAMELAGLLDHPRLGLSASEARLEAEKQLESVRTQLDAREETYATERAALAVNAFGEDAPRAGAGLTSGPVERWACREPRGR